ncbi:hypothetical protein VTL71DRAFT_4534 [Oculimacula yallundae]|uniref:C2H2-type domain-containing protein n=1 Tax=Oculimacula yallundae TaxID=86028 RepID=A0ABR4C2B4_9HELO
MIMSAPQTSKTRWSKSFPTLVTTSMLAYTCSFERDSKPCMKKFSRQCDLRQHQKNHTRPFHCPSCASRFPSPKDLDRHENAVHNKTLRYCCPYNCQYSFLSEIGRDLVTGFPRKDSWLKHLRERHSTSKDEVKAFQKAGIPIARNEGDGWVLVVPAIVASETKKTEDRPATMK